MPHALVVRFAFASETPSTVSELPQLHAGAGGE